MLYVSCLTALKALLFLVCADKILAEGTETLQSVGKIRSSADLAFSKGEIDQALKLWTEVIKLEPKNENNFYKRFRVYLRQQKYREALADLNSALHINENDVNVLTQKAKLQMKLGKCKDAEADFATLSRFVCQSINQSICYYNNIVLTHVCMYLYVYL